MNPFVPVVDPTAVYDPSVEPEAAEDYAECLFDEGWTFEQIGEWAKVLTVMSRHALKLSLTVRNN